MNEIVIQCILGFTSQILFLLFRTINIHATANLKMKEVMISGFLINATWIMGIGIGANGAKELIMNGNWYYLPVVLSMTAGSMLGAYIGIRKKKKDLQIN